MDWVQFNQRVFFIISFRIVEMNQYSLKMEDVPDIFMEYNEFLAHDFIKFRNGWEYVGCR